MSHYLCVILVVSVTAAAGNIVRDEDICGAHNGRRLYLELGEQGVLYARNVSFVTNAPRQQASRVYVTNSSHDQCSLELVTCPSCVITLTFKHLELSHHCGDGSMMVDSPCRCDYVWISEPPYEDASGTPFCGLYSPIVYRSSTRTLSIALLYSQSHRHAFTMEYTAERNRLHLKGADVVTGVAKTINSTGGGILTSPFFPARYPRDLGMEYIITCPTDATSCRVRVLFSDFHLATVSIIEFYDWNGQRLDVSSGARFRPPVIVSSGPSLLIRFYANGGTGLGYKAFYSFVVGHQYDKSFQPITDCGGYVENLGGAITMMDMVGRGAKTYDCVWLIRPPKNFLHMKTHMYLKVVTFTDMAGNTELTIKQGPTSALSPLEILRHPASQLQPPRLREHVAPMASGFHVSLRGTFGPTSRLAIAYAAFSYMDCFAGTDFLCQNHRCIPSQLNCDGFDHCGDNSDEPATCSRDWDMERQDRKWHMNKANYYFPKIDRYPDLKTATLVFVASSLGLIVLISALIVLLYRMGARARQQRELQSRLQTISELLDGARIDEISVSDDPPVYEAPPGYDEVAKVGLESEGVKRKRKRNARREPRSRSTPNQHSVDLEAQPSSLVVESASTNRSCQTTPVPPDARQPVPGSPPPPYITPSGTIARKLNISLLSSAPPRSNADEKRVGLQGSRARHTWIQYTDGGSSSQPITDDTPAGGPAEVPSTSVDAEAQLGAYLKSYVSDLSETSAPQPPSLPGASKDTSSICEGTLERAGENVVGNEYVGLNCTCAGACGCANEHPDALTEDETLPETTSASKEEIENNSFCPKTSIIELLGSFGNVSRSLDSTNLNSTTVSTGNTPNGTFGRAFGQNYTRKASTCSRESCITKISFMSSRRGSYDESQEEFEIISETASNLGITNPSTMANTPNCTPKVANRIPARSRSCSTCDLESLYEGIRALDLFLAQRGAPTVHKRNKSVVTIGFRTPDHCAGRSFTDVPNADHNVNGNNSNNAVPVRISRSTDDVLII